MLLTTAGWVYWTVGFSGVWISRTSIHPSARHSRRSGRTAEPHGPGSSPFHYRTHLLLCMCDATNPTFQSSTTNNQKTFVTLIRCFKGIWIGNFPHESTLFNTQTRFKRTIELVPIYFVNKMVYFVVVFWICRY